MLCERCGYKWKEKKENPISCPRCKRRFDYPNSSQTNYNTKEKIK
jgi:rubrerythrin